MSAGDEDTGEAVVAFVGGILFGLAATLLYARIQKNRAMRRSEDADEYHYDGGDLFV